MLRVLARRAPGGASQGQSPARRRAAAERSGAALITGAEVSAWVGGLVARCLAPSTATRALATLRSILAFAVADGRVQHNVAASVRRPTSGRARREGRALTLDELHALTAACAGPYRDVVPVLALAGLRWGELAGLQVGDRVSVPGPGLSVSRAVLASGGGGGGALHVDTLKNNRARTVPLVNELVPIVDRWSAASDRMRGYSMRQVVARCVSRTGSGRLAGWLLKREPVSRPCAFMICATRRRRYGWAQERTRRWFSACWGMPPPR